MGSKVHRQLVSHGGSIFTDFGSCPCRSWVLGDLELLGVSGKVAAQAMEVITVHDVQCPSAFHGFLGVDGGGRAGHGGDRRARRKVSLHLPLVYEGGRTGHGGDRCARRKVSLRLPWVSGGFLKVATQAMEVITVHDIQCPSAFYGFLGVDGGGRAGHGGDRRARRKVSLHLPLVYEGGRAGHGGDHCARRKVSLHLLWVSGGFWRWP